MRCASSYQQATSKGKVWPEDANNMHRLWSVPARRSLQCSLWYFLELIPKHLLYLLLFYFQFIYMNQGLAFHAYRSRRAQYPFWWGLYAKSPVCVFSFPSYLEGFITDIYCFDCISWLFYVCAGPIWVTTVLFYREKNRHYKSYSDSNNNFLYVYIMSVSIARKTKMKGNI
jgi:hypothetical protein